MANYVWFVRIEPDGKQLVHFECSACRVHIRFSNKVGKPVAWCCGKQQVLTTPRKKLLSRYAKF
jgi:hypothetical protein